MWFPKPISQARWLHPLTILVAGIACTGAAGAAIKEGDFFPRLDPDRLKVLTGGGFPELEGKVLLVDFWASWCAPCRASFPAMEKLQGEFSSRGFAVVAVGIDEKSSAAAAFVKKLSPGFPTLHDPRQELVRQVEVPTMPTSFLVGRDGKVRFIYQGFHGERTESELRRRIDALLTEPRR